MKKIFVIFFFLFLLNSVSAQEEFVKVVAQYYRVNPFEGKFSSFIKVLSSDTALHNKQLYQQTDTTGYYLRGVYDIFNPFSINANKIDMVFYESEQKLNSKQLFAYYTYQLTAYFPDNEMNRKAVKKDFQKLDRRLRRDLKQPHDQSLKGYENIEDGMIYFYSSGNMTGGGPATISWQTLTATKQLALTIIIRIIQKNNRSYPYLVIYGIN